MASKRDMSFDEFAALCPDIDIEEYRDQYMMFLDTHGAVFSNTIGFNFSIDEDDPDGDNDWTRMAELFAPIAIWAGNKEMLDRIKSRGRSATLVPYFEGGGFMVVLKTPVERKKSVKNSGE